MLLCGLLLSVVRFVYDLVLCALWLVWLVAECCVFFGVVCSLFCVRVFGVLLFVLGGFAFVFCCCLCLSSLLLVG